MKAVILAAGIGSRLGKISKELPKPMLIYNKKPLLYHNIIKCREAGANEIFINLHHLPHKIKDYFGDGSDLGVNIKYSYEKELLGTAGAIKNFSEDLKNSEFFVLYGDNYSKMDLKKLVSFHREKRSNITIALFFRNKVSLSGIVKLDNDRIIDFREKPKIKDDIFEWVNGGIYFFNKNILNELDMKPKKDFAFDIFPSKINKDERIFGYKCTSELITVDTKAMYVKLI